MAEQLKPTIEQRGEQLDATEASKKNLERIHDEARKESDEQDVDSIQQHAEQQAISGQEVSIESSEANSAPQFGLHQELKTQAYDRTLKRVQSKLSGPEKSFSKLVHTPSIDSTSNALGKTIVRPSGVLGGGLLALVGSSYLLYSARHLGHEYNYTAFFILFAVGFGLGVAAEIILKIARK